jgi:hypothetical protein
MASSYSPLLRLELIGSGEQAGLWGETTNKNLGTLLEQAVAGVTTISLSGGAGTFTLSVLNGTQDQSRSMVLRFIGSPSGEKVIEIPTAEKLYVARNDLSTSQKIIFKTAGQISDPTRGGVELLAGEATLVFCDGSDARAGIQTVGVGTLTVPGGGTGVTSFTGGFVKSPGGTGNLTSSATVDLASDVSGTLPVARGGTGATSLTSGNLLIGNGTGTLAVLGGSSVGQVATWNGSTWVATAPASSGVSSFNGRTGAVVPQSGDYSAFYPSLTGSGASGTWGINISGNAATATSATSATTASSASSVPFSGVTSKPTTLSGYGITDAVNLSGTQTITGNKTFNGGIVATNVRSPEHNFHTNDSIFSPVAGGNIGMAIANVVRFEFGSNGDMRIGGQYLFISDPRLKDGIENYTQGLASLNKIRVRSWTFNGKGGTVQGRKGVGVIATEIESVLPEVISENGVKLNPTDTVKTMVKTVNHDQVLWTAVKAIQELSAKVEELQAEITALKAQ